MTTRKLLAAAFFVLALSGGALAQSVEETNARIDMLFGDHESLVNAFDAITAAVRDGDAETVSAFVKYPFQVEIAGKKQVFADEAAFVAAYADIVTPAVAEAVTTQDYADLFSNSDGVMFGDGQMWLTSICTDDTCASAYWVISAINQ